MTAHSKLPNASSNTRTAPSGSLPRNALDSGGRLTSGRQAQESTAYRAVTNTPDTQARARPSCRWRRGRFSGMVAGPDQEDPRWTAI